jgi:ribosomal protein S18 acetylase RimI-like enzyme
MGRIKRSFTSVTTMSNSNTSVIIRNWGKTDFPAVRDILQKTWTDTYSAFIPQEDLDAYLLNTYNDEQLQKLFDDSNCSCFLVEIEGVPRAWMRTQIATSESRFYISSLYVLPGIQGYGIGKKLLDVAIELARSNNFDRIYLGVMKQNLKALAWYEHYGFIFDTESPFRLHNTEVMHLIGYKPLT